MNSIKFKKLNSDAIIPSYKTSGAAGMDICSLVDATIRPGHVEVISTGLSAEIPEGYELQVRSRSGLAMQRMVVVNSPGTIDSDYRGEIKIIITYLRGPDYPFETVGNAFNLYKGDRIAQLVLAKVDKLPIEEVEELSETERGEGGLGSTGLQ